MVFADLIQWNLFSKAVLYYYSKGQYYRIINKLLRNYNSTKEETKIFRPLISLLQNSVLQNRDNKKGTFYRGLLLSLADVYMYEEGKIVTFNQFTSTTPLRSKAENFTKNQNGVKLKVLLQIELEDNEGRDISGFSFYPGESEILLPCFISFYVIQKTFDSENQLWIIRMDSKRTIPVQMTSPEDIAFFKSLKAKKDRERRREKYRKKIRGRKNLIC